MSSVSLANKILNLQKPPPEVNKKGRSNRAPDSFGANQPSNYNQQQPSLYYGFNGIKENPMFNENPGFSPVSKEENNFTYYRQNENINTIKVKNKKPYDGSVPVKGGEKTAATEVLNEFRSTYLKDEEGKSLVPQKGLKPLQQQKYFSKFSPQPLHSSKNPFSFTSIDFKDPATARKHVEPMLSPGVEEVPERNKDFNVDEVLTDYRNKRQKKGSDKPISIPQHKESDIAEKERRRNEELNAKLSGYVYTSNDKKNSPPANPSDHIYQSLKHVPTEVQQFYNNEAKQTLNQQKNGTEEKEFNAWNAFRPTKQKTEKSRYISKEQNSFHFGVMSDDTDPPQVNDQQKRNKLFNKNKNDFMPDDDMSSATKQMFPDLDMSDEIEERKPDFSINQVLSDYKSKHVYKEKAKVQEEKHEAVLMKEKLPERNKINMEKEKQRMEKLKDTNPFKEATKIDPRPMEIDVDTVSWVASSKRQSTLTKEDIVRSEKRERMDVENWEAPEVQPMEDENIVHMEYLQVKNNTIPVIDRANSPHSDRSYRDQDGWTRASPLEKVNPGPTTQALDYFIRSPNMQRSEETKVNENQRKETISRQSSSRSNPNVTFTQKEGKDIVNEFKEIGATEQMIIDNPDLTQSNTKQSFYNYNGGNREIKSRSEPNLFMSKEKRKNLDTTELNQLNFSKMSSNLRRSGMSNSIDVFDASRKSSLNSIKIVQSRKGPMKRGPSSRSRSTLGSGRESVASHGSIVSNRSFDRNVTTITLAKSWSGRVVSTNKETKHSYDYGVNIPRTKNVNALVFRNSKPIEHVEPTDKSEEALNRLNSLDRRLKSENDGEQITSKNPMYWMANSPPEIRKLAENNSNFYRESKQPVNEMDSLCEQIKKSGLKEGQNMRVEFYEYLHKMTAVVNEIIQSLPKDHFPFKITPCSYQGDFQKKGARRIDLYLNIEDLKEYTHQVNFLMKRDLAGYVILKGKEKEKLKSFCAKNRDSGDWVLSANRLMVVFSYLVNTKLRSQFEKGSAHRRKKIAFDAEIKFDSVSEHEVRLNISFPGSTSFFNVGLLLALNVTDFPNVIDMNKERTWPSGETKAEFVKHGVHLIAKPGIRNHGWGISFLKTRKILLGICDKNQTATSILLALQVLTKTTLSNRDCDGLLLPEHFIMVLFWMHEKHQDPLSWSKENMGKRFIDIIIGVKRCIERKACPDFFFPPTNYLQNLVSEEKQGHLLQNVDDVLNNPQGCLVFQEHQVSTAKPTNK